VETVTLEANHCDLLLRAVNDNWYEVTLRRGDSTTSLGGESLRYIAKHLTHSLSGGASDGADTGSGVLAGVPVRWVMTLSGPHTIFYRSAEKPAEFFVQGPEGELLFRFAVSRDEALEWIARLRP
jgi:hypothetical protein